MNAEVELLSFSFIAECNNRMSISVKKGGAARSALDGKQTFFRLILLEQRFAVLCEFTRLSALIKEFFIFT